MTKSFKNLIIFFSFIAVFSVFDQASAAVLNDAYLLTEANTISAGALSVTGSANLKGIINPITEGGDPSLGQVYYKSQKNGTNTVQSHASFSSNPNGEFDHTITSLDCGASYTFWLYETPGDTLIQVDTIGGTLTSAFSFPITCAGEPPGSPGDVMAPSTVGAEVIGGVNWGNISVTDHSINITGARVIPLVYGGQKTFKIEYGTGSPGNGQPIAKEFLGFSPNIVKSPPYNFSSQIGALVPNTNYYFNIWEVSGEPGADDRDLEVFGYAQTNQLETNQAINYTFPSATSVNIYGNMVVAGGQPLEGLPINIEIRGGSEPDSTLVMSETVTIGGANLLNGNGFYQHTFTNLTANTQYFIFLRNANTESVLTGPVMFVTPDNNPLEEGPGAMPAPEYNGLVACDGPDCHFNEFIETVNRVINFVIFFVAFPIVGIVAAWAGFNLIMSGGNSSKREYAVGMLWKVLIGLVCALLCWAIIKLVLITFGYVPTGELWEIFGMNPPNANGE